MIDSERWDKLIKEVDEVIGEIEKRYFVGLTKEFIEVDVDYIYNIRSLIQKYAPTGLEDIEEKE